MDASNIMVDRTKMKRLMREAEGLKNDPLNYASAYADDDNINKWYFIFICQYDHPHYNDGHYLGEIILSKEYPYTPPDFIFYTPNGRFDINRKICLTITGYHKESWNPNITIRAMLIQLYSIFIEDDTTGLGHIKDSARQRHIYRDDSINFNIKNYKKIYENFDFTHLNNGAIKQNNEETKIEEPEITNIKEKLNIVEPDEIKVEQNLNIVEPTLKVENFLTKIVHISDDEAAIIRYSMQSSKKELIARCSELGIRTTTKMTKAVLLDLIKNKKN